MQASQLHVPVRWRQRLLKFLVLLPHLRSCLALVDHGHYATTLAT